MQQGHDASEHRDLDDESRCATTVQVVVVLGVAMVDEAFARVVIVVMVVTVVAILKSMSVFKLCLVWF